MKQQQQKFNPAYEQELKKFDRVIDRERRERAAVQIMSGMMANYSRPMDIEEVAEMAVEAADELLLKLDECVN